MASNGLANVWMFGEEGKVRAQFGFDTKGPAMWLFDKEGTGRLVAGFSEGELPGMWLDDKEGQPVSRWVQNASGFASLEMLGTGGFGSRRWAWTTRTGRCFGFMTSGA